MHARTGAWAARRGRGGGRERRGRGGERKRGSERIEVNGMEEGMKMWERGTENCRKGTNDGRYWLPSLAGGRG